MSEERRIQSFCDSGKFAVGTIFCRDVKDIAKWSYFCPVCACDGFCVAGLCTGIFTSTVTSLKAGVLSCRCNPKHRKPFKIVNFEVERILDSEGLTFLGWVEDYSSTKK